MNTIIKVDITSRQETKATQTSLALFSFFFVTHALSAETTAFIRRIFFLPSIIIYHGRYPPHSLQSFAVGGLGVGRARKRERERERA
mmetsp:Transcript_13517/g.32898  ORF Transcript_13517/g.32898 Transcript_13517/m.32898 type:complete len:87 (+) Transcript_13517:108-368(+)